MLSSSDFLMHAFSDMSILEQHFYTDAGVNLPVTTNNEGESSTKKLSKSDTLQLNPNIDLKNATDDIKANLQRINKDVVKLKISQCDSVNNENCKANRSKRHSIAIPTHNNGEHQKKMLNRRSLSAIPTRETSRIPVSSKGINKIKKSDSDKTVYNSSELNTNNKQINVIGGPKDSNKQKPGNNVVCFKGSLNSCNKENVPKLSGLPVLMR